MHEERIIKIYKEKINYIQEYERGDMANVINSFAKDIKQERKSYAECRREDDYEDLDKDYREYVGIRFWI